MSPRSATWWRTVGAAAVIAGITVLPVAASASAPFAPVLLRQSPVAMLSAEGVGQFTVVLNTAGANRVQGTDVSIFPMVHSLSALNSIITGDGVSGRPLSSTGSFRIDCPGGSSTTFYVTVGARATSGTARATCSGARPTLDLHCHGAGCAGVYPLKISTTNGPTTSVIWSLLAATPKSPTAPVGLALVLSSDPLTTTMAATEARALTALAANPSSTAELTVSYPGLAAALFSPSTSYAAYRSALVRALASVHHTVIDAPPDATDFAGLAAHGFAGDVATQVRQGTLLLSRVDPSKVVGQAVELSGPVTTDDLAAMAHAGVRSVVLTDTDLTVPPSSTLQWGTPLHLAGAPASVTAVTTDTPLADVAQAPGVSPGLRAALTLGELALLHFEAPFDPVPKTVVLATPLTSVGASYLRELFDGLRHDPLVNAAATANLFNRATVGADGDPATWSLAPSTSPAWSSDNVRTLKSVDVKLGSLYGSIYSLTPITPLMITVLESERRESAGARQRTLDSVDSSIARIVGHFHIDDTTITLAGAGAGATLPITLTSTAPYTITGYLHLSAPNVSFPDGPNIAVTLAASTDEIRVAADIAGTGNFTLRARFVSFNRDLVIATGAIQVRSTSTSVVGYAITALALIVIALWWYQTSRRRSRGKHAR